MFGALKCMSNIPSVFISVLNLVKCNSSKLHVFPIKMPKKKGKKEKKEIIMIKNNKNNPHKLNPFDMFRLPVTYTLSSQIVGVPSPSPSPPFPPKLVMNVSILQVFAT